MSILGLQVFEMFASYSTRASGKLGGKREKKWFSLFFDLKYVPIEIQLSLTNWRKEKNWTKASLPPAKQTANKTKNFNFGQVCQRQQTNLWVANLLYHNGLHLWKSTEWMEALYTEIVCAVKIIGSAMTIK